jgi:hypothetical protein
MTKAKNAGARPPERWTARPLGGGDSDRLGALLRTGAPSAGLEAAARARVWGRLRARARPARLVGLRVSVAGAVLLASTVVVAGAAAHRFWPRPARPVPAQESARKRLHGERPRTGERALTSATQGPIGPDLAPREETSPRVGASPTPRTTPLVNASPPNLVEAPPTASGLSRTAADPGPKRRPKLEGAAAHVASEEVPPRAAAGSPAPPRDVEPGAPPTTPTAEADSTPAETAGARETAPPPSGLAVETALLADGLARLRQRRDARGALAALDTYDARFPHGALRREAEGARVDALLLLGRDADALDLLRNLTLEPRGRDQELRVIRAELEAPTQCTAAVSDFDRVLAEAAPPALAERALHGRATCLARMGDAVGAKRDLRAYLRRFPDGRFAAESRRLLDEMGL